MHISLWGTMALLWDIRRNQEVPKPKPTMELDGHGGQITHLHMDSYKIVAGGAGDNYIYVWETDTGMQTNTLNCASDNSSPGAGYSAMAVSGLQVATAAYCGEGEGLVRLMDFTHATRPVSFSSQVKESASKFWNQQKYSDSDEYDDSNCASL